MKKIILTKNKFTIIDDEDYKYLKNHKWCAVFTGRHFYAFRTIYNKIKCRSVYMHREILNPSAGLDCDHINGDTLDNRKENLRMATRKQNLQNEINPRINNKFKIKGVCWHKTKKKFQAQIRYNGKRIFLGRFSVLGDADDAYRRAEIKYFGEFARKYEPGCPMEH